MKRDGKEYDLVAVGESLIDFVSVASSQEGCLRFDGHTGGGPANVLAMAGKLGLRTAVISKVGTDVFGRQIREVMEKHGVDTKYLLISTEYPTTLAFVSLDAQGERSFSFYRKNTADVMLSEQELDKNLLQSTRCLHFASVSLTVEPSRSATLKAAWTAKEAGALISFDMNLRPRLWEDVASAKKVVSEALHLCNAVKLSEEELYFLTDLTDIEEAMRELQRRYPEMQLLAVTLGSEGAKVLSGGAVTYSPGFKVETRDTTGAGDTFWGAFLFRLLGGEVSLREMRGDRLTGTLAFANAAAALSTMSYGAISSMPTYAEIESFLAQRAP
ncbi:MAG: carbohydrate kinase [Clostridiaceae bacterium]|nr:carbohydrate kinase [Clostridiaceae bacterium]